MLQDIIIFLKLLLIKLSEIMCGKKDEQFTSQNISSNKREVTKAADPKIILK